MVPMNAFEKWQSAPPQEPKKEIRKAEFSLVESEQGGIKLRIGIATESSPDHPEKNEDSFNVSKERGVCVVADGVGGGLAGDLASAKAAQSLTREQLSRTDLSLRRVMEADRDEPMTSQDDVESAMLGMIDRMNDAVLHLHRSPELLRMAAEKSRPANSAGSTASLSKIWRDKQGIDRITVANIGDSRIYRLRKGRLERLTKDDSLVQTVVDHRLRDTKGVPIEDDQDLERRVSREEVERAYKKTHSPLLESLRNILVIKKKSEIALVDISHYVTQTLGSDWGVRPFVKTYEVEDGDIFLHCSDGLSDVETDVEMQAILNRHADDPLAASRALQEAASERSRIGTHERAKPDDVTAVVTVYHRKKPVASVR